MLFSLEIAIFSILMNPTEIKTAGKSLLGMSQQELAAKVGVSFLTVNRRERGHSEPQSDRLQRLRDLVTRVG